MFYIHFARNSIGMLCNIVYIYVIYVYIYKYLCVYNDFFDVPQIQSISSLYYGSYVENSMFGAVENPKSVTTG